MKVLIRLDWLEKSGRAGMETCDRSHATRRPTTGSALLARLTAMLILCGLAVRTVHAQECALCPGLNNVALVSVTNTTSKGSPKLMPELTRALWHSLVGSRRFLLQDLTEINPCIKRGLDEQSLKRDVVDAFKQTPSVESAAPLAVRAGVPLLFTVAVQDYKEIAPEAEVTLTPEGGKQETVAATAPAATATTASGDTKAKEVAKEPAKKRAKKKKPMGPGVEITLLAQMFCVGGEGNAPMQAFKSIVMSGTARARSATLTTDTSALELEAIAGAVKNIVRELVRDSKRRK